LQYHDSIYQRQWFTSIGDTSSQKQFTTFWDTTGGTTLDVMLVVENLYGCVDTVQKTLSFNTTDLDPTKKRKSFMVYPNPFFNYLIIKSRGRDHLITTFQIADIHGRIIHDGVFNGIKTKIDFSFILPGIYIIKLRYKNSLELFKIVKHE
jgi:Secretion system C-terminal sorting domain